MLRQGRSQKVYWAVFAVIAGAFMLWLFVPVLGEIPERLMCQFMKQLFQGFRSLPFVGNFFSVMTC